jgi:Prophage CP4-57 regulatory protein (AlpA)
VQELFVPYMEFDQHGVPLYSRVHPTRLMRAGLFPAAVQLSGNRIAWRLSDLERWKASRPVARAAQAPGQRRTAGGGCLACVSRRRRSTSWRGFRMPDRERKAAGLTRPGGVFHLTMTMTRDDECRGATLGDGVRLQLFYSGFTAASKQLNNAPVVALKFEMAMIWPKKTITHTGVS